MPFIKLTDLTAKEIVPGYHGRFVHTEHNTVSQWEVEAGATLPEHAHEHEQISIVLEGKFELTVDGEARLLEPGEWAVIPSNVPHSGKAHTACTIMDIFYPVREDYR
jgi:quercetin dioxygenase-like cupin family protein